MRCSTWLPLSLAASAWACTTDNFTGDGGPDSGSFEAGNDALVGADGSQQDVIVTPKRFCEGIDASFCADFDIPNDAGAGFLAPVFSPPYALLFEQTLVKSKPTAVEVEVPTDAGGAQAVMTTVVGGPDAGAATTITLDLDIYLPSLNGISTAVVLAFAFGGVGGNATMFGIAESAGTWMFANLQGQVRTLTAQPATGEWAHAQVIIHESSTTGDASIIITSSAGVSTGTFGAPTPTTALPVGPYPAQLQLGVQNTMPPQNVMTFYYDNVVIQLQ
jgi:hypothetical protein